MKGITIDRSIHCYINSIVLVFNTNGCSVIVFRVYCACAVGVGGGGVINKLPFWWQPLHVAMANIRLTPPELFNFSNPDKWPCWKCRFEQFRFTSGVSGKNDQRQISTLLYCLREGAEDVLSSTNISGDERKTYSAVLKKFDDFFQI